MLHEKGLKITLFYQTALGKRNLTYHISCDKYNKTCLSKFMRWMRLHVMYPKFEIMRFL